MTSPSVAARTAPDTRQPRLIIPALGGFYAWIDPYVYPLIRFTVGATVIPNGIGKIMSGQAPVVATMTHFGFEPVSLVAFCVTAIESIGGLCIALGFLTRFWAAAFAIELGVVTFVVMAPGGYARMELFMLWGLLAFFVALKGSGRYSVDRLIGWEL